MALDKIKFVTNVPIECALKYPEGKLCDSQFGDPQYMFTTTEDRCFFVAEKVAAKIHGLRLKVGEPIDITKAEVDFGHGRKGIEWQIAKVGVADPQPQPKGKRGVVGEQPDGTFALPAPERALSAPAQAAASQPPMKHNGNGNSNGTNGTNGSNGNGGNPHVVIADGRPRTMLEDALKTVVAAVHATTEYAKSIGYAMPQFTSEDLRTMANTIMIGKKEAFRG
jgi:hypothetical protein